ncbi:Mbeg1-like protein [Coralloluteibacterium thermophilus]|uniref:Mbeg1-like protein n=1 Tax=Coralloluteibacterium thermophilum TaxID=2707049 RepID=A0ABV9NN35_9GAMM
MSSVNAVSPFVTPSLSAASSLFRAANQAAGWPQGDGGFSGRAAGTVPDRELDYAASLMANDVYAADNPQTEQALQEAGWTRLQPSEDGRHLVDADGNAIPIDPALLSTRNGFDAAIFQNDSGEYVVAFRGTDDWGLGPSGDGRHNALQGLGFESGQYSDAIALAQRAERVFGDGNVIVTGHSLGGGLASAAALATGATGITFNAAGLSDETLRSLGFNPNAVREAAADSGQIRRYVVDGEVLTGVQQDIPGLPFVGSPPEAVGRELRVARPEGSAFNPIDLHGGGGDGAPYVDALRDNRAWDPALRPTLPERVGSAVDDGLDAAGSGLGSVISGIGNGLERALVVGGQLVRIANPNPLSPLTSAILEATGRTASTVADGAAYLIDTGLGLAGDGLETVIGVGGNLLGDTAGNLGTLQFNQLSTGIRQGAELGGNVLGTLRETRDEIAQVAETAFARGDVVEGSARVAGHVLDAGIDTVGNVADTVIGTAGEGLRNTADFGGSMLRDVGDRLGIGDATRPLAEAVENAGSAIGDASARAGEWVSERADRLGNGAEAVLDAVGSGAQRAVDTVGNGVRRTGEAIGDGVRWLGQFNPFGR